MYSNYPELRLMLRSPLWNFGAVLSDMEISCCRPCVGASCAGGKLLGVPQGAAAKLDRFPACSSDDGSKSGGPVQTWQLCNRCSVQLIWS